ncbi:hypothetical protein LCGC14_1562920 [marine sediment metagenome]|uniref:Uncharacterized protein n=1 Tax=marine sediment metagenome TaxID=412755 RepID=A0A0F9L3B3_9ZZZZ
MDTKTLEKTKVIHVWQNCTGTFSYNNQIYADIEGLKTQEGIDETQKVYVYSWTLKVESVQK